jgi:hypothetical protein
MKFPMIGLGLLAVLLGGCGRETAAPSRGVPLSGAEANVLGATLDDADGRFSYRMPRGWSAVRVPELRFLMAQEGMFPGYRSNIRLTREAVPLRHDLYLKQAKGLVEAAAEGARIVDDDAFATAAGLEGRRWLVRSKLGQTDVLQIFYVFPGQGDEKIVMTASCTRDQEPRLAFVFDAAAKTLVLR